MKRCTAGLVSLFLLLSPLALRAGPDEELREAIDTGDPDAQRRLAAAGAGSDEDVWGGGTALHYAVEKGSLEAVTILLEAGFDPNEQQSEGEDHEYLEGPAPLHLAAYSCHFAIAKLLLDKGADLNLRDRYGVPPWFEAASCDVPFIELLISHGMKPAELADQGTSLLHEAAREGNQEAGAEIDARDTQRISFPATPSGASTDAIFHVSFGL